MYVLLIVSGGSTAQPPTRVVPAQSRAFENVTPQLQSQSQFIGSGHIAETGKNNKLLNKDLPYIFC